MKKLTNLLIPGLPCLLLVAVGPAWAVCNANIPLAKPDSVYSDNLDGTVTDTETGLMWAKCSVGQTWVENTSGDGSDDGCTGETGYTWKSAHEQVQTANAASHLGFADWRLPNIKELESLVESACVSPAINTSLFPSTPAGTYWTSSPYAGASSYAWWINFSDGGSGIDYKYKGFLVRLVRGGQ